MSALAIYKIFALSMLLICFALYWPLRAASLRVRKEIEELAAQDAAESQAAFTAARTEDVPR